MALYYAMLALGGFMSWVSMGLLSMLILLVTYFLIPKMTDDVLNNEHKRWLKNTIKIAVLLHVSVVLFEVYEFKHLLNDIPQNFLSFITTHWLMDYLAEIAIALLITSRGIKGFLSLNESKSPYSS